MTLAFVQARVCGAHMLLAFASGFQNAIGQRRVDVPAFREMFTPRAFCSREPATARRLPSVRDHV